MHALSDLMSLFDFTAEDLAANHAGRLSGRQRAQIEAQRLNASIEKASVMVSVGAFLIGLALYLSAAYPLGQALGPWVLIVSCTLLTLITAAASFAQRFTKRWLRRSAHSRQHGLLRRIGRLDQRGDERVREGRVERIAGLLTHADNEEHAFLLLDGEPFELGSVWTDSDDRLWKLAPGFHYAFYAVPDVGWITSVEPLESESPP